jgi:hypothetical protein
MTSRKARTSPVASPIAEDSPIAEAASQIEQSTAPAEPDTRSAEIAALKAQLAAITGAGVALLSPVPSPVMSPVTGVNVGESFTGSPVPPAPVPPANVPDRTPVTDANVKTEGKPGLTEAEVKEAAAKAAIAIKAAGTFGDRVLMALSVIERYSRDESLSTTIAGLKVATGKLASMLKLAPKLAKVNVVKAEADRDLYSAPLAIMAEIDDYLTKLRDAGAKAAAVKLADLLAQPGVDVNGPVDLVAAGQATAHAWRAGDQFAYVVASVAPDGTPTFERRVSLVTLTNARLPQRSGTGRATTVQPATGEQTTAPATAKGEAFIPHPMQPDVMLTSRQALELAGESGDRIAQSKLAMDNSKRTYSVSTEAAAAFRRLGWAHPKNA